MIKANYFQLMFLVTQNLQSDGFYMTEFHVYSFNNVQHIWKGIGHYGMYGPLHMPDRNITCHLRTAFKYTEQSSRLDSTHCNAHVLISLYVGRYPLAIIQIYL